jgi:hypothetical protein
MRARRQALADRGVRLDDILQHGRIAPRPGPLRAPYTVDGLRSRRLVDPA